MKRIIFGGSMNPLNRGDQARIKATIKQFGENEDIKLAMLSHNFAEDTRVYAEDAVEIVKAPWSHNEISLARMTGFALLTLVEYSWLVLVKKILRMRVKAKLFEYDSLVITSGIDFSDFVGRWPIYYCFFLISLFGLLMGKPVMCYAQSMGPIENRFLRKLARFFLNSIKVISVRDDYSLVFLRELQVTRPKIFFTADPAFLLLPAYRRSSSLVEKYQIARNHRPLIGVSLSSKPFAGPGTGYCSIGIWFKVNKDRAEVLAEYYTNRMAKVCDQLVNHLGVRLVFLPNCTAKWDDDREVMAKVCSLMSRRESGTLITDNLKLWENMEVIGKCDLFLGTRLHANILAAVMGVPVVALVGTDGPRVPGIMKMLGIEKYVCNILSAEENDLISIISEAWSARQEIRGVIQSRMPGVRERALGNISVLKDNYLFPGEAYPLADKDTMAARRSPSGIKYRKLVD
jgi:colanic acid/amylovoran biosynthesis protein